MGSKRFKVKKRELRKLIRESIKKSSLKENLSGPAVPMPDKLDTVGDMLQFAKAIRSNKKAVMAATGAVKVAADLIPGVSSIRTVAKLVRNMYKLDDKLTTKSGLDNLNVDDDIAKIVDDKVENAFLNSWIEKLEKLAASNPNMPLEKISATRQLSNYLEKAYNKRTVDGFE